MSMSNTARVATESRRAGEGFVHSRAFEWLSRGGFVARGFVYAIVGVLALKLALGAGGKLVDQKGAFHTVAHQPFGSVLLTLLAIGLAAYALWRLVRAAIGHGPEGADRGVDRVAALASGLVYAGLFLIALRVLMGSANTTSPAKATGGVLGWPAGTWLVGIAGLLFVGIALYQGYRGITKDFLEDAKTEDMSPATKAWIGWIGLVGYLARMVVFGLVGVFLLRAALDFNPRDAVGLDGALAKLLDQPYGSVLLGVVAAGLLAFAIYSWSDARYRRI
jgi:Domain of Unknown Function (DUF1206)